MQEIFYLVNKELHNMGFNEELPGGVVLTGGVASIEGIELIAQVQLGNNVRVYQPEYIGVSDPIYTTGVGIIHHAVNNLLESVSLERENNPVSDVMNKVKDMFSDFFG